MTAYTKLSDKRTVCKYAHKIITEYYFMVNIDLQRYKKASNRMFDMEIIKWTSLLKSGSIKNTIYMDGKKKKTHSFLSYISESTN